ncbi:MAG: hypothetical protein KGI06_01790 [Candidatus Micrarchaeota archaeon]|nr:hypothetical protein [Candidatus Micrarchaeota archaeon]
MNAQDYISRLKGFDGSALLLCEHCGAETPAKGTSGICSNCESMIFTSRKMLQARDHMLLDALDRINSSMGNSEYENATKIYEGLIAERKDPALMYAAAIAYLRHSNYEISQIGYAKPGFMEENSAHRDRASKLVSSAKRLLARLIRITTNDMSSGNEAQNVAYTRFLAQIKMGSLRGAKHSMGMLQKTDRDCVYEYAGIVYDSHTGKYEGIVKAAESLMLKENFPINTFYYLGFALFKKGNAKDAKSVLQELAKRIKNGNLDALIFEVDYQLNAITGIL